MTPKGNILVAVGDAPRQARIRDMLEREGVGHALVSSGSEAIRKAVLEHPDVILVSQNLPDMSGLEVCGNLRIDPELSGIPVVVLEDTRDGARRVEILEKGADYCFSGEEDWPELRACLLHLLRVNRFRTIANLRAELQRANVGLRFMQDATDSLTSDGDAEPHDEFGGERSKGPWGDRFSLSVRGSRVQFFSGLALASLMPVLALVFVMVTRMYLPSHHAFQNAIWPVLGMTALLSLSGLALLSKYPRNIVRMRRYLEGLASGRVPEGITLSEDEEDLRAIRDCLRKIIQQTEERVRRIQRQEMAVRAAERQRVIIESLGTACHHLGQPATVLMVTMHIIKRQEMTPEMRKMVDECDKAIADLREMMERLQKIAHYRTENYRFDTDQHEFRSEDFILEMPT